MRRIRKTFFTAAALILAAIAVNALEDVMDDAKLSTALAQAREQRLADLHAYAEQGIFPHNHGHRGERIPYFMDRHGRLCAVGYLVASSMAGAGWDYSRFIELKEVASKNPSVDRVRREGRLPGHPAGREAEEAIRTARREAREARLQEKKESDRRFTKLLGFFNEIATANNNIRIMDVHDGPILEWILRSGLTQEEAALIQPGYSYLRCDICNPGSEAHPRAFHGPTPEAQRVADEDRVRIRAHLLKVEKTLRARSAESLKTAAARLNASGPVRLKAGKL